MHKLQATVLLIYIHIFTILLPYVLTSLPNVLTSLQNDNSIRFYETYFKTIMTKK